MRSYNISEIHFEEIEPLSLSKKMKQATNLYRACKFDEAEKILTDIHTNPHQIADIKAQLAFFSWEFDKAIEYILEYYPYLGEWYSGNKNRDTQKMLAFSLLHASEKMKKQAIAELQEIHDCFSKEQLDKRGYYQFTCISQILDIASGNYQTYKKPYSPPEKIKSYEEILQGYAQYHEKELKALHCLPEDDIRIASDLLLLIMDYGKTTDFIRLYEKHCKSSKLYYRNHLRAIHIYLYLQNFERAKEAASDYVKYGWIPIEWTDVMPVSLFDDYCFVPVFTKDLFSEIYSIPKGVDDETKFNSETLQFHGNFDDLFAQADKNEDAVVVDISKISIVSGKIVTADPLMHLNKETLPFSQKIPKGEYFVKALIRNKGILAVKVIFTEEYAVKYVNALIGNETQTEINELGEESFFGFSVDSGLAALMDDKVKREYLKFEEKWCKKNKSFDFYSDYLVEMFSDSAKNYPEYQSDDGDYIDFQIPDTNYHIPIFSTGSGDGSYPVFFGYDQKGKLCSMIIAFDTFDMV